jgi:hypothetical protein
VVGVVVHFNYETFFIIWYFGCYLNGTSINTFDVVFFSVLLVRVPIMVIEPTCQNKYGECFLVIRNVFSFVKGGWWWVVCWFHDVGYSFNLCDGLNTNQFYMML